MALQCPQGMAETLSAETRRWCKAIRFERVDGQVLGFTDHDSRIRVRTEVGPPPVYEWFTPAAAPGADAHASTAQAEAGTSSLFGFIDADGLIVEDLRIGIYRDARVDVMVTDWRYPWAGWSHKWRYWVGDVEYDGASWRIELHNIFKRMDVRVGRVYNRLCDAQLGDARCGKDLSGSTSGTRTVSAVSGWSEAHPRLRFRSNLTTQPDNWWQDGRLTWLTGDNAITGLNSYQAKLTKQANGEVELWTPTPYDIQVGDAFVILPGCGKQLIADCRDKHGNVVNHRGHQYMSGIDRIVKTPGAKS